MAPRTPKLLKTASNSSSGGPIYLGLSISVYISVSLAYIYTNMHINKKKSLNILVFDFYNVGDLTEVLILLNTAHLTRDVLHDDKSVLFVLLLHPKNGFSVHLRKVG